VIDMVVVTGEALWNSSRKEPWSDSERTGVSSPLKKWWSPMKAWCLHSHYGTIFAKNGPADLLRGAPSVKGGESQPGATGPSWPEYVGAMSLIKLQEPASMLP
jgi:hypothetical protein